MIFINIIKIDWPEGEGGGSPESARGGEAGPEAGGEVVETRAKSNLQAVIGSGTKGESRTTGELVGALGVSPAKQDKDGNFNVKVGFADGRSDGRSNSMIAGVLEYGKHGQPAKPFLKPAKSSSKNACIDAMKAAFEQEVEHI